MEFVDFRTGEKSASIKTLFPGWKKGESVAFLSPHDDDAALGAGYLVQAVLESGGRPHILVFCKGDAGYSTPAGKRTIVRTRRRETLAAYATLGINAADIHFFGLPDLSLMAYVNRKVPGREGVLDRFLGLLRAHRAGRVVFSSPHYENWDHTAVYNLGMYAAPQAGDPILADLGQPSPVRTRLVYAIWGDFAPAGEANGPLRADAGILAGDDEEELVRKSLRAFASQKKVMENTVARHRDRRKGLGGRIELYQRARVREPIDYRAYFERLKKDAGKS
ncbi:MAG: PIG-L deacetylase family protein [Candidatus Aminicenantales bacterium]